MNTFIKKILPVGITFAPWVAYGAIDIGNLSFKDLVQSLFVNVAKPATTLMLSLAVVFFLWNIFQFIRKSDQPEELEKFKSQAIWGIVAIFVMVSLWALVHILVNTFTPGAGVPTFR
jgi:hypothetical protein